MLRSATLKIGASGSWLTAMIVSAPDIPAICCTAPDMPNAKYVTFENKGHFTMGGLGGEAFPELLAEIVG